MGESTLSPFFLLGTSQAEAVESSASPILSCRTAIKAGGQQLSCGRSQGGVGRPEGHLGALSGVGPNSLLGPWRPWTFGCFTLYLSPGELLRGTS